MSFELTLGPHPAVARCPIEPSKQLKDDKGNPVPLLEDHKSIRMKGVLVGYVLPGNKISLIRPESQLTKPVVAAIKELVAKELGAEVKSTHAVPPAKKPKVSEE